MWGNMPVTTATRMGGHDFITTVHRFRTYGHKVLSLPRITMRNIPILQYMQNQILQVDTGLVQSVYTCLGSGNELWFVFGIPWLQLALTYNKKAHMIPSLIKHHQCGNTICDKQCSTKTDLNRILQYQVSLTDYSKRASFYKQSTFQKWTHFVTVSKTGKDDKWTCQ